MTPARDRRLALGPSPALADVVGGGASTSASDARADGADARAGVADAGAGDAACPE
jgi:hypothetical protein